MSNVSMTMIGSNFDTNPQEKIKGQLNPVMTPVCISCRRKISGKDRMFLYVPEPYYGVIHKECAPFNHYLGVWPHSQSFFYYAGKSLRPQPGKTPSPGTM